MHNFFPSSNFDLLTISRATSGSSASYLYFRNTFYGSFDFSKTYFFIQTKYLKMSWWRKNYAFLPSVPTMTIIHSLPKIDIYYLLSAIAIHTSLFFSSFLHSLSFTLLLWSLFFQLCKIAILSSLFYNRLFCAFWNRYSSLCSENSADQIDCQVQ